MAGRSSGNHYLFPSESQDERCDLRVRPLLERRLRGGASTARQLFLLRSLSVFDSIFFKERMIRFLLVDLAEKGLSKGELRSVAAKVPHDQLINRFSKRFVDKGLSHAWLDSGKIESLLLQDPLLFRTPVVRNGKEATVGHCPEVWKGWE